MYSSISLLFFKKALMTLSKTNTVTPIVKGKYYNWKRYWKSVKTKESLTFDRDGFLIEKSIYTNTNLKQLEELEDKNYLILIGEPGIGKTKTFELYENSLNNDSSFLFIQMNDWETKLEMNSFFNNELKNKLKNYNETINLYLDSLDECRLEFKRAATCLIKNLRKLNEHKDRLKIRITCRTADLSDSFKNDLFNFYENDDSNNAEDNNIFELVPLTKEQVLEAAKHKAIENPKRFTEDLINADVVPLAIVPLTLEFLLEDYKETNKVNPKLRELYIKGIKKLLEDANTTYKELERTGTLLPDQKLSIAAGIAAISIFCNNSKISKKAETSNENSITFDDIFESQNLKETSLGLTKENINEVLHSALFTYADSSTLTFRHKSYAEFLAAYYLYKKGVPLKVVQGFFYNDLNKVYPQLKEVAVWYTHFSAEFLDDLIEKDYEILLNKNTNHISDEKKEKLIDRYIIGLNEGEAKYKSNLKGLVYESLNGKIIKEFQNNPTDSTKSFLISLAHLSKNKKSLVEPIFKLLSTTKSIYIKEEAVTFIDRYSDNEIKKKLIPVIQHESTFEQDKEDQLRGIALGTIYKQIDFEELLLFITNQKNENLTGNYSRFIKYEFLPYSFNHTAKTLLYFANNFEKVENVVELIGGKLVENAVSKISETNVDIASKTEIENALFRFIQQPIIRKKRNSYLNLFDDEIHEQKPYKYDFFEKLICFLIRENHFSAYNLVDEFQIEGIFSVSDLDWLLRMFQNSELDKEQEFWFEYIKYFCYCKTCCIPYENLGLFREVFDSSTYSPFTDYYRLIFKGVVLGSKDEDNERKNYNRWKELKFENLENEKKEKTEVKAKQEKFLNLEKTLADEIDRFRKGELKRWWYILNKFNDSKWDKFSKELKSDIINVARVFLVKNETKCDCDSRNCKFDLVISKTFNLLLNEDKAYLEKPVDQKLYEKWADWILFSNVNWLDSAIIKLLYSNLPERTVSLIKNRFKDIQQEKASVKNLKYFLILKDFFDKVSFIENESLNNIFHNLIIEENKFLDFEKEELYLFKEIVEKLLHEQHPTFLNNIKEWLENDIKEDDFEKFCIVLSKSFYYLDSDILDNVVLMFCRERKFEKYFIEQNIDILHKPGDHRYYLFLGFSKQIEKLDFVVLKNWFKHLVEEYNTKEDSLFADSKISAFKEGLLYILISKSTDFTVVDLLKDIKVHTDDKDKYQIDDKIHYAIKTISANNWKPMSPSELLAEIKTDTPLIQTKDLRVYIEQIDSFTNVKNVSAKDINHTLSKTERLEISEDKVQLAIESILNLKFHQNDWGGETNDLYTANVVIDGERRQAAFLLKGNGTKSKEMQIKNCGKNGNQIVRLFGNSADLFIIQYIGPISEDVVKSAETHTIALRALGKKANFCIINGQDTARLLGTYNHLEEALPSKR